MFDFNSITDFSRHIDMSIPNYTGLISVMRSLSMELADPYGLHIDIGCSTGTILSLLPNSVEKVGVDQIDFKDRYQGMRFIQGDATDYLRSVSEVSALFSLFTLQFMGKKQRSACVDQIARLVREGATAFIAEKIYFSSPKVNTVMHRSHMAEKRGCFTDSEILDKDQDLIGSMFCKDEQEITSELSRIGKFTQIWQSFHFKAWVLTANG